MFTIKGIPVAISLQANEQLFSRCSFGAEKAHSEVQDYCSFPVDAYSCRAKFLADQVDMLEEKFVITQREQQPERQTRSDSDNEGISDPEI